MKARSFKKFFVSIALSAILTFSSTAAVFAATAQLSLAEQSANSIQEDTDILLLMILMRKRQRLPILLLDPVSNRLLPL